MTPHDHPFAPPAASSQGKGCLWAVIIMLVVMLGFAGLIILGLAADKMHDDGEELRPGPGKFQKKTVDDIDGGGDGDGDLLLIDVEGVISNQRDDSPFIQREGMSDQIVKQIRAAQDDKDVKGLLLALNTPGGGVTPSDEIHHAIEEYKDKTHKPVVAHMADVCASGGVYVAVAADEIIASPTTITGSIGVIMGTLNFHELMEKYGVKGVTVKSGARKDLLSPTKPVNEEDLKVIQELIDSMYGRFVALVAKGRNLDEGQVRAFADGSVFTAERAQELKLVDGVGYRAEALERLRELAKAKKSRLVRYKKKPSSPFEALFTDMRMPSSESVADRLAERVGLGPAGNAGAYYLWRP